MLGRNDAKMKAEAGAGRIALTFFSLHHGLTPSRFHDVILMIAPSGIYIGKAAYPHQYHEYDE